MNGEISFNGNDLQTYDPVTQTGIIVDEIDHSDIPEKLLDIYAIANANKSAIAGDPDFVSKVITVTGTIVGSSVADLADRIDTFKGYFNGKDKNLDIGYGSGTRRYIATADKSPSIKPAAKRRYSPFTLKFVCTDPFGRDLTATNLWAAKNNFTAATFTEAMTVGGNAPYQLPVFTIHIDALTGAGDYLLISNDNNNQEILLYGLALVAGDTVVIDCAERKVTVNNVEVDYYGTFLELEPGANSITYTDGFTTRQVDVSATYVKRWL
jgi:phage-related protein